MTEEVITGTSFDHVVFSRKAAGKSHRLHIYIEGDGQPWINGRIPATDPTPSNPLALRLMALDPADAIYIGRPCYFGTAQDTGCEAELWTFRRYSREVVASMTAVTHKILLEHGYSEVVLIGYSGGGAIVTLMAPDIPQLSGILTVAANLDTDAWTRHHNYLPLTGSVNPALLPATNPQGAFHVQLIAGEDRVVPPAATEGYRVRRNNLEIWEYPDYDHSCCWAKQWPALLARFEASLSDHMNGSALRHQGDVSLNAE